MNADPSQAWVTGPLPPAMAVLDSNVLLDVVSFHDLARTYEDVHGRLGAAAALNEPQVVFRRARARESLLLALYFHKIGAVTYNLADEPVDVLQKLVPPADRGAMELHYATIAVWFVQSRLLTGWTKLAVKAEAGWVKILANPPTLAPGDSECLAPTANNADAWHIACAKRHGLPLITNEGFNKDGYRDGKIAKRARADGVNVMFPKDFYAGKMLEVVEIDGLFARFDEQAPAYLAEQPGNRSAVDMMLGTLHHVLHGETGVPGQLAKVTIP